MATSGKIRPDELINKYTKKISIKMQSLAAEIQGLKIVSDNFNDEIRLIQKYLVTLDNKYGTDSIFTETDSIFTEDNAIEIRVRVEDTLFSKSKSLKDEIYKKLNQLADKIDTSKSLRIARMGGHGFVGDRVEFFNHADDGYEGQFIIWVKLKVVS
jgi:tRNA(Phe) wybutosine-synthesizing methylase Tyw3